MRLRTRSLTFAASVLVASTAQAEIRNFVVTQESGTFVCRPSTFNSAAEPDNIVANVTVTSGTASGWTLKFGAGADQTAALTTAPITGTLTATFPLAKVGGATLSLAGKVSNIDVKCADFTAAGKPPAAGGGNAGAGIISLDADAQGWLLSDAGQKARRTLEGQLVARTTLLVHLPSGHVAALAPASLSEADDYQLAVIVDRKLAADGSQWHADVNVSTCSAKDPFRIKGDFSEAAGVKFSSDHEFILLPVERPLSCGADKMGYTMTVSLGDAKADAVQTTWRIRPIYHLAAAFAPGFDLSKRKAYPVVNQKIAATNDTVGLGFDIGFTWFPWGVDYENMRWYNHVVNPFVLFNASAPTEGVKIGTALTPTGGISIGIGAAINKSAVRTGSAVGDTLATGEAVAPKAWNKDGVGWYFGVLIDDNIFKALKGLVGSATKSGS